MTKNEYAKELNACEILSIEFSGCVGIVNGEVIQNGKVIASNLTLAQWQQLFSEYYEQNI